MKQPPGYDKPLPTITPANAPYWQAARNHELRLPRCGDCRSWVYPIAPLCQRCWSEKLNWEKLSGRGTISSWVVFQRAFHPGFADDVPYHVVEVELEEGMRMVSNLVGVGVGRIRVGMAVEAVFDNVTSEVTLLKFRSPPA